jgi:HD-GYP domain-containing protein (c-di-GMP phosphodiesterase class II)
VAEAYDAMTSSRLRAPLTREDAVQHLLDERGQAYDAETVDAFAEALRPRRTTVSTDGARYGY